MTNKYLLISKLIDPSKNGSLLSHIQFEKSDIYAILSIIAQNKVPLATLDEEVCETYSPLFSDSKFKAQYQSEYFRFETQRNEWGRVKGEFLRAGIESILIKSVGAFPYESSNLDVLIRQSKREKAESILKELGYIQLHNVEEPFKTLFRTFTDGKANLAVHLHNKVAWINPFHDEDLLWARYQRSAIDDLVDIPSPEDSILILTAHWFYEDKKIKLSDIMKISSCVKKGDLDWDYMKSVAEKKGWLDGFYFGSLLESFIEKKLLGESPIDEFRLENMKAGLPGWMRAYFNKKVRTTEIALPFKLPKIFGKVLHFSKTLKDKTTSPSRKLYELYKVAHGGLFALLFYKFQVNIRHQRPMLISISGVDGSGKSTYAKTLYDILTLCELRTKLVWSRVGSSSFLKPFSRTAKILYRWRKGKRISKSEHFEDSEARRKDLFKKSCVLRILGLSMLLSEVVCQYLFKVTLPLLLRKVVVCDRYIYDTLVDMATRYELSTNSLEGRLFNKILTALIRKPDVAYVLDVSLENICSRRDVNFDDIFLIRERIDLYKKISLMYNLQQINNDQTLNKIRDEMIHEILSKYYEKWEAVKRDCSKEIIQDF